MNIRRKIYRYFWNHPERCIKLRTRYFLKNRMHEIDPNKKPFVEDFEENCKIFLTERELQDEELINQLKEDCVRSFLLGEITPDEYFLHDFRNKSEEYKRSILSRWRKSHICWYGLGKEARKYADQLQDKWQFYLLCKPYFKREVCRVVYEEKDILVGFCERHPRFVAKPRNSSCGIGVQIVDVVKMGGAKEVVDSFLKREGEEWLFEEFIEQDPRMAEWHPSSVNTIRVPSIMTKDGPVVILPLFRTGKNGNIVDNCHNDGGLMAVPDAKTGILLTDGYDVFTNVVEVHPNSGKKFKGWQVPEWDNLIATAAELHKSMPKQHKYIGFDFALTNKGWAVVEGNWGNFPHQVCVGYGIRDEFEKLMKN